MKGVTMTRAWRMSASADSSEVGTRERRPERFGIAGNLGAAAIDLVFASARQRHLQQARARGATATTSAIIGPW